MTKGAQNRTVFKGLLGFFILTAGAINTDVAIFSLYCGLSDNNIKAMVPPNEYPTMFTFFLLVLAI